ncbi:SCO family protein [Mesobacillus harenae]|uniref:SCO family protein n=1 Tax=Mesobacillus harenae TaxID=2213203 RepID=UPI00157FCC2B|nr:SCO family protein [Mesobacillus harenae]
MRFKILFLLGFSVLLLAACGGNEIKDAHNWPVEDFSATNQDGESFGLGDLEGKVWMADFIFTNCEDVCFPMTANMAKLQRMAAEAKIENIEFVSFSVDPSVDDPNTLSEFANSFNADLQSWNFLTGYSQEEIESFAVDSFKTLVKKPQQGDQVAHGTSFYLVNQEGTIVKDYSGLNEIPFDEILEDIKTLQ